MGRAGPASNAVAAAAAVSGRWGRRRWSRQGPTYKQFVAAASSADPAMPAHTPHPSSGLAGPRRHPLPYALSIKLSATATKGQRVPTAFPYLASTPARCRTRRPHSTPAAHAAAAAVALGTRMPHNQARSPAAGRLAHRHTAPCTWRRALPLGWSCPGLRLGRALVTLQPVSLAESLSGLPEKFLHAASMAHNSVLFTMAYILLEPCLLRALNVQSLIAQHIASTKWTKSGRALIHCKSTSTAPRIQRALGGLPVLTKHTLFNCCTLGRKTQPAPYKKSLRCHNCGVSQITESIRPPKVLACPGVCRAADSAGPGSLNLF